MDFLSYRETGHIGGPSGKGHIRALDIGGIRRYREISHVWYTPLKLRFAGGIINSLIGQGQPKVMIYINYEGPEPPNATCKVSLTSVHRFQKS